MLIDKSDTVWGVHVQAGASFDVSRNYFVGVELKSIFTDKADLDILKSRINGRTATINFGYRF